LQINYDGLYTLNIENELAQEWIEDMVYKSKKMKDKKFFSKFQEALSECEPRTISKEEIDEERENLYYRYILFRYYNKEYISYLTFEEYQKKIELLKDDRYVKREIEKREGNSFVDSIGAIELLVALIDTPTQAFIQFTNDFGISKVKNRNFRNKLNELKERFDISKYEHLIPSAIKIADKLGTDDALEIMGIGKDDSQDWLLSTHELKEKLDKWRK